MDTTNDRRSLLFLISLLTFLMVSAFVPENYALGDGVILLAMYLTLLAGTREFYPNKKRRWPGAILAGISMLFMLAQFLRPAHIIQLANWFFLSLFLGFVSVALFSYLGQPGSVTRGRLYGLVNLYLLLGVFYYAIFNLLETLHPRSFMDTALPTAGDLSRHSLLYLSFVTLTTVGFGDVVPLTPGARIIAALEAATGVLYIAITVARLVAAYTNAIGE